KYYLIENYRTMGEYFTKQLKNLQKRYEFIGDVRGKGLALGVELVKDKHTKVPAAQETAAVCYRSYELGLLVYYVGINNNVMEITPPLDRKSTRLNSSHVSISYAVFCLK